MADPINTVAASSADEEITLAAGDLRLKTSPYGASLRGFWRETEDGPQAIVTVYTGAANKAGGQGDVLVPFPGRVKEGRYTFAGQTHQMPVSDKDGPNTIHGFVRTREWQVADKSDVAVTYAVALSADDAPGYPFALSVRVTYALSDSGMTCHFVLRNDGDTNAPVAAGFHPYFTVGSDTIDNDLLQIPMGATLEFVNLIPTGNVLPVDGTPYDFRSPKPLAGVNLNTCYLNPIRDPDGLLRIRLSSPSADRSVTVWMDAAFDFAVLYSADPMPANVARRSLAIEPMTSATDALNHPEWGLKVLAPDESFEGTWGAYATFGSDPDGV